MGLTGIAGWSVIHGDCLIGFDFLKLGFVPINSFSKIYKQIVLLMELVHIRFFQIVMSVTARKVSVVAEFLLCLIVSYFIVLLYRKKCQCFPM